MAPPQMVQLLENQLEEQKKANHGDQAASGEIWSGTADIWKALDTKIVQNILSKGQLPAECDLRRGQYKAVHEFLQYWGKLALTPGHEPWAPEAQASQD